MEEYAKEDGSCKFLGEDNLCMIYDKRPPICNVAWVYENFFKDKVSEAEFYARTQDACDKLGVESHQIEARNTDNTNIAKDV